MIPGENVHNNILAQSFLEALDIVVSPVYLKIKYHNDYGRPLVVKADLRGAHKIHEAILKNPLLQVIILKKGSRKLMEH